MVVISEKYRVDLLARIDGITETILSPFRTRCDRRTELVSWVQQTIRRRWQSLLQALAGATGMTITAIIFQILEQLTTADVHLWVVVFSSIIWDNNICDQVLHLVHRALCSRAPVCLIVVNIRSGKAMVFRDNGNILRLCHIATDLPPHFTDAAIVIYMTRKLMFRPGPTREIR